MGYYINTQEMPKEQWLIEKGKLLREAPSEHRTNLGDEPKIHYAVCLVNNGLFTAAAIAFDQRELDAFKYPSDRREKLWFYVDRELLLPFCPILQ
jgi:hypothetical protein